eukprot:349649-Chlamydomonas_euryale.AAC.6
MKGKAGEAAGALQRHTERVLVARFRADARMLRMLKSGPPACTDTGPLSCSCTTLPPVANG